VRDPGRTWCTKSQRAGPPELAPLFLRPSRAAARRDRIASPPDRQLTGAGRRMIGRRTRFLSVPAPRSHLRIRGVVLSLVRLSG
jgi:hypothetical protein